MDKKIIIALDSDNFDNIKFLLNTLRKEAFAFKIGYEFFFNFGLEGYKYISQQNIKIFLDLKLHDIPNTVYKGIQAIAKLNPYFTTIHLSGGDEMQKSANKAKNKSIRAAIIVALKAVLILSLVSMCWVTIKNNGVVPKGSITIKYKKKV